jgi:hypothetical protein
MTEHSPPPDELAARQRFYSSLSDLQEEALTPAATCGPDLRALLALASEHGFCWVDTGSELIVAHIGGHQIACQFPRETELDSTGEVVAWALGLPLELIPARATAEPSVPAADADADEPEAAAPDPQPAAEEEEEEEDAAAPEPDRAAALVAPGRATTDPLTENERNAALAMVKGMTADQRKSFTLAFRHAFSVPREEKAIAPLIQQFQHLQFVDRFTGEAAGVVVP